MILFFYTCLCSLFLSVVWLHFSHKNEKFRFWKSLKYFIFFDKKGYGVRFEYVPWKNVWFCFIYVLWFHYSHKPEKFRFWKSLKYFNIFLLKKRYGFRFEYVPWKNVWFCFISNVWVNFSRKTEKFSWIFKVLKKL